MAKGLITTKRIGVLMGGLSSERDISIRSGLAVYQSLQELGYDAVLIDAGKDIANALKKEKVKLAFILLHGGMGENGTLQGMLEVLGISYTGSGVLASALAMDKEASKKIFLYHGLSVPPFVIALRHDKGSKLRTQNSELKIEFNLPWIVKPVAEGSSVGITIIKEKEKLSEALGKAFQFGKKAIIEKFISGKEVHIGILGEKVLGGVEVRPSSEFYSYDDKYSSGLTEYVIPPELDPQIYERAKEAALQAHIALGCSGATRVDLKIDEAGASYVLEVNTIPGMTGTSLLPKIAQSAGMNFNELIEEIIRLAVKEAKE